ncbi:MAG: AAA family ATPase [Thermodesulfobacteriota bacterium]
MIIAVCGKGGVGKTTLAALLVLRLAARGCRPVLAVDADPNACLDAALGLPAPGSVGALREDAREARGMSKHEFLEYRLAECLAEGEDFDLLAMGRPEGPGCYCFANSVLRDLTSQMSGRYPYVVLDNEAGLENLSRRLAPAVDLMILASDPSARGLATAARIRGLARELGIKAGRLALAVNRLSGPLPPAARDLAAKMGTDLILQLPEDPALAALDREGTPLDRLPADNPLVAAADAFLERMLSDNS